jgi:hypothetical protein
MQTLILSAVLSALTGVLYAYVGVRLGRRKVSPDARPAQWLFVLWWYALAVVTFLSSVDIVLYLSGNLPIWAYQTVVQVAILLLMAGLGGLMYYLVYLYTGNNRFWALLLVYYILFFIVFEALLAWYGTPRSISDDGWRLVSLPKPETQTAVSLAFGLLLIGPQMGAAVAYALLYRRAVDATQRYRIALVAGSIFIWFGSGMVATAGNIQTHLWWQVSSQVLAALAAIVILIAYLPPRPWRTRWGLRSIDQETAA